MSRSLKNNVQLHNEIKQLRAELTHLNQAHKLQIVEQYQSEAKRAVTMYGITDGLWDWDIETNYVYYSPRWKMMLGYDESELANDVDTWLTLVHPDDKQAANEHVHCFLSNSSKSREIEMRLRHKLGHYVFIRSSTFQVTYDKNQKPVRVIGTHVDITERKKAENFSLRNTKILKMIAKGRNASDIYDEIALLYEERHPGLRCSLLELDGNVLRHGGAPSLPKAYCKAVDGLVNGPNIGSCGTSTYTGKRVLVEDIATDPKWASIKQYALPHGLRSCWSEPIKDSSGKVLGALGMYHNHPALPTNDELSDLVSAARLAGIIMEREQHQKQVRRLAYNDELTGLASRAYFRLHLKALIEQSKDQTHKFSLLYIDIDNFKSVNDTLGHDVGDLYLIAIAEQLGLIRDQVELVARISGDEFCIVTREPVEQANEDNIAQQCLRVISQPVHLAGRKLIPTCSIGIAHFPEHGDSEQALLKAADTAMYTAKSAGRNQCTFYSLSLTKKAEYRFKVEHYLKEAIEQNQITLVYQPQIHIKTGEIVGLEALARWHHRQLGSISPVSFITMAEQIGMIKPLTEKLLKQACQQIAQWRNKNLPIQNVAVNISPSHFKDDSLIPLIEHVIDESHILPADIKLEVTEGVVQTSSKNLSTFRRLKKLGILTAIDDFGTGYSSFASLQHLDVDYLKIDKYFIKELSTDNKSRILTQSMIEMGHNLGYKIIAEGIETEQQFNLLKQLGCDIAQGYFLSKPVDADSVEHMLQQPLTPDTYSLKV